MERVGITHLHAYLSRVIARIVKKEIFKNNNVYTIIIFNLIRPIVFKIDKINLAVKLPIRPPCK